MKNLISRKKVVVQKKREFFIRTVLPELFRLSVELEEVCIKVNSPRKNEQNKNVKIRKVEWVSGTRSFDWSWQWNNIMEHLNKCRNVLSYISLFKNHSSKIRGLYLMKWHIEMPSKFAIFLEYKNPSRFFFSFCGT